MTPEQYRQKSEVCHDKAEQARSPHDRAAWLKLAGDWLKLAEETEARKIVAPGQSAGAKGIAEVRP